MSGKKKVIESNKIQQKINQQKQKIVNKKVGLLGLLKYQKPTIIIKEKKTKIYRDFKYEEKLTAKKISILSGIELKLIETYLQENQITEIDYNICALIANEFNIKLISSTFESLAFYKKIDIRDPIICVMGHIDHGKTSTVDVLLNSNLALSEHGGITQNISIHKCKSDYGSFLLIDTPGHAIFSLARQKLYEICDFIILVVDAQAGHIANEKQTKKTNELLISASVIPESYGGDTITSYISAKNKTGFANLLENIAIMGDDIKTEKQKSAIGYILDVSLDKGGYTASIILIAGNMKIKDHFITETSTGIIKTLLVNGKQSKSASVNDIICITGFNNIPKSGEKFYIVDNIKQYEDIIKPINRGQTNNSVGKFNFIIKADSYNQLEALTPQINGIILSASIGSVTPYEIELAKHNNAIIVIWGKNKYTEQGITYIVDNVIYRLLEKIEELDKPIQETQYEKIATAEILKVFEIKNKKIAGCKVINGKISLGDLCAINVKEDTKIQDSILYKVSSLKREKDDIKEAIKGSTCGIILNTIEYKEKDILSFYKVVNQNNL